MPVECPGDLGTTGLKIAKSDPDAQRVRHHGIINVTPKLGLLPSTNSS